MKNFKFDVCGFEHLHLHTDFSLLDGYGTVEEYAKRATEINQQFLCISDHGMMGAVPRQIKACDKNGISPIFACFFKGQMVETDHGRVPIEEICPEMMVLTHKGRYRKVVNVFSRKFTGRKYGIALSGDKVGRRTLWMTDEHPVLVADPSLKTQWVKVCDIVHGRRRAGNGIRNWRSYVCYPKSYEEEKNLINFAELVDYNWSNGFPVREYSGRQGCEWPTLKKDQQLDYGFCKFIGLYVAEGSMATKEDQNTGSFRFSFHSEEVDYQQFCLDYAKTHWGLDGSVYQYDDSKVEVHFCCKPLADILEVLCGKGSHDKHLPWDCFSWSLSSRLALLEGLLSGDGKNPDRKSNKGDQMTLKVASRILAEQTRRMLMDFGQWASLSEVGDHFQVAISPFSQYRRSLSDDRYVYKPIREVFEEYVVEEDVFNIEVEEDNSYVVDFAVHNCELYVNKLQPEADSLADMQAYIKQLDEKEKAEVRQWGAHLLAIAYNETGYKNLVKLSSWGWCKGFYYRPRVNYDVLQKYKEGIIFTSCCYSSEVGRAFDRQGPEAAMEMIDRYVEMFGRDHYYLEFMLLDFAKQKPYNKFIVEAHEKTGLPLIVTNDCFPAGTMILTKDGYRAIESLRVGDVVFTAQRNWKQIQFVNQRKVKDSEKVYSIKCSLGTELFKATEEHPVWVAEWNPSKTKVLDHKWKKVSEIHPGDYLVFPALKEESVFASEELKSIDLSSFVELKPVNRGHELRLEDDFLVSNRGFDKQTTVKVPVNLPIDADFLFILGWYLAEGSCDKDSFQISFGFHINETKECRRVVNYFAQFGVQFSKGNANCENGIKLIGSSKVFHSLFSALCGTGASHKQWPLKRFLSKSQVKQIFSAYVSGDGCPQPQHTGVHTTSNQLVWDLVEIANCFGVLKLPEIRDCSEQGWSDLYALNFGQNARRFFEDSTPTAHRRILGKFRRQGDYFYCMVQNVVAVDGVDVVWNLQIEDDETYIANSASVHNCHYCKEEDSKYQRLMLMVQTNRTIQEIEEMIKQDSAQDFFELQDQNLWMKSEEELNAKWLSDYSDIIPYELFCDAKRNTVEVCRKAQGVKLDRSIKLPVLSDSDDKLKEAVMQGFKRRDLPKRKIYLNRIKEEYELICRKGFSSYFLIQKMICDEARRIAPEILGWGDGSEAVGPGRGSAVGALTCYCLGITDVNPIYEDLLFSRFLSEARGGKSLVFDFKNIDPYPPGYEDAA